MICIDSRLYLNWKSVEKVELKLNGFIKNGEGS